jgi:hypothetical protein
MTKLHGEQIEECKSIFPTWTWIVGLLGGSILVIATCIYAYAQKETNQDAVSRDHATRIERVEKSVATIDMINVKLDTLIQRK